MNDRFVYLSKANLRRVRAWYEAHREHPLAEAYTGALDAMSSIDIDTLLPVFERNRHKWRGFYTYYNELQAIETSAMIHRDRIGRLIIKLELKGRAQP